MTLATELRADWSEAPSHGRPTLPPASFFGMLDPHQRAALVELGRIARVPPRSVLMHEGEPGETILIVLDGHAKATSVSSAGREILLCLRGPGDVLGEVALLDGGSRLASVTSIDQVEAVVVRAPVFERHLERVPHVAAVLARVLVDRLREAITAHSQQATLDTMGRVAARLVELSERYGEPSSDGIEITLGLSQDDLCAWTGSSRASVAKALQSFRELGWVTTHRRRIMVIDFHALRSRAAT